MQILKTAILGALVAAAFAPAALARGGKDFYSQDYQFDRPMKGYEGQAGNYYCSYQRLPNRVCATSATARSAARSRAGPCASTVTEFQSRVAAGLPLRRPARRPRSAGSGDGRGPLLRARGRIVKPDRGPQRRNAARAD
ncbi:MAG: hypothetical protein WDN31_08595 [Hyphomicrobium sp.]